MFVCLHLFFKCFYIVFLLFFCIFFFFINLFLLLCQKNPKNTFKLENPKRLIDIVVVRLNLINHLVGFILCQICLCFSN